MRPDKIEIAAANLIHYPGEETKWTLRIETNLSDRVTIDKNAIQFFITPVNKETEKRYIGYNNEISLELEEKDFCKKDGKPQIEVKLKYKDSVKIYELSSDWKFINEVSGQVNEKLTIVQIGPEPPNNIQSGQENIPIEKLKIDKVILSFFPDKEKNCRLGIYLDIPSQIKPEDISLNLGYAYTQKFSKNPVEYEFSRRDSYFKQDKFDEFVDLRVGDSSKRYHLYSENEVPTFNKIKDMEVYDGNDDEDIQIKFDPVKCGKGQKEFFTATNKKVETNTSIIDTETVTDFGDRQNANELPGELKKLSLDKIELQKCLEKSEKKLKTENEKWENERTNLNNDNSKLRQENKNLAEQLADLNKQIEEGSKLKDYLEGTKTEIQEKTEERKRIINQIKGYKTETKQWEELKNNLNEKKKEIEKIHANLVIFDKWDMKLPESGLAAEDSMLAILNWSQTYNETLEEIAKENKFYNTKWIKFNNLLNKLFEKLESKLQDVSTDNPETELVPLLKEIPPELLEMFEEYFRLIVKDAFPKIYKEGNKERARKQTKAVIHFLYPYFQLLKALDKK